MSNLTLHTVRLASRTLNRSGLSVSAVNNIFRPGWSLISCRSMCKQQTQVDKIVERKKEKVTRITKLEDVKEDLGVDNENFESHIQHKNREHFTVRDQDFMATKTSTKWILVLSGKYRSVKDVPDTLRATELAGAYEIFRIVVMYGTMVVVAIYFAYEIYVGKKARQKRIDAMEREMVEEIERQRAQKS